VIGSGLPAKSPHPRTTFLPPLSPHDLAHHMQESMIFLTTSRYESFGLAAAEAHACGCATHNPKSLRQVDPVIKYSSDNLAVPNTCHCFNGISDVRELIPDTISESFLRLI